MRTSAGFVGVGKGNIAINSDGRFKYEPPHIPDRQTSPCEGRLSAEELKTVGEAIGKGKPEGWKLPGLNVPAPDAFQYELELHRGGNGQVYEVKWYDNTRDQLPDDLKRLSEAVDHAMQVAAKKCGG